MTDIEKIIYDAIRMVAKTNEPEKFAQMNKTVFEVAKTVLESLPKVHGWVARDMDGELNFFGSELGDDAPIYDGDLGMWGNATDNKINISRESGPFGDLNYYNEPVEVELLVRKI